MPCRFLCLLILGSVAFAEKLTDEDKIRLIRGLTAEFANAKVPLPRSKRPLSLTSAGSWDKAKWAEAMTQHGQAAKPGDQVQVTKVDINSDNIIFEINGGLKTGNSWRDRIQVGMGSGTRGTSLNRPGEMKLGTTVVLEFGKDIDPNIQVAEVKKLLSPVFDFDKHSATESYVENLPPEIQAAIKAQRVIEGMDREQVQLVLGKPRLKSRESKDGVDFEDWVYGIAPGKITFVTFEGKKVVRVKESYAGLGGEISAKPVN